MEYNNKIKSNFFKEVRKFSITLGNFFIPIGIFLTIIFLFIRQSISSNNKREVLEIKIQEELKNIENRTEELDIDVENIKMENQKIVENKIKRDEIAEKYIKDKE